MDEFKKQQLINSFSQENMNVRYGQAMKYFGEVLATNNGVVEDIDYKMFVEVTLKRDFNLLSHAYLQHIMDFEMFYEKTQQLVGFNIMIQKIIKNEYHEIHV